MYNKAVFCRQYYSNSENIFKNAIKADDGIKIGDSRISNVRDTQKYRIA